MTDVFQHMQSSPILRHMLAPGSVVQHAMLEHPVCVQPDGTILCGPERVGPAKARFFARLAVELAALVTASAHHAQDAVEGMDGQRMARILLAAVRVTACAWRTGPFCPPDRGGANLPWSWGGALAGPAVPDAAQLALCVADMACCVAPALRPRGVDAQALHEWACTAWPVLQPAEWLVVQGGDERLDPGAQTGLNRYGCQPFPRYGELDFSSSTASTPTLAAAHAIHQAGVRLIRLAVDEQAGEAAVEEVKAFLAAFYHLDGAGRVVLAPSGTDCALAATALMGLLHAPLTTILPGVEETGSGVPLATCGRHFANRTARGQSVQKGAVIDGFMRDAEHVALPLRADGGERVPDDALFAACAQQIARAVRAGRRVLLYVLHVSKTGQLVLPASRVRALCARYPGQVDVLVDACQARLRPEAVHQYVSWGWAVMVTGSKFFTGPPFSGALFLPDSWLDRLRQSRLPTGLAAYATRAEWPDLPAARTLPLGLNAGLFLRWSGARAEMVAFAAVPDAQKRDRLHQFMQDATAALDACPFVRLLPSVALCAQPEADAWDSLPSILAFVVLVDGAALDFEQAKHLHGWLLADMTPHLPATLREGERALAALPCHVGQPVAITTVGGVEAGMGALRVSASARHISGTGGGYAAVWPAGLSVAEGGVAADHPVAWMLAKLGLILRYWADLAHATPPCGLSVLSTGLPGGAGVPRQVHALGRQGISALALRQS
ncbi:GMP reductase [Acetobacter sp. LMG 32666]|uniref:GMP reductase n=1 Tax=Acetobacter sp. LMG 32666 TaxID=2959295 RepID=UPI0030C8A28C